MGKETQTDGKAPSFLSVIGSVVASMFGVQSSSKHEEDFTRGKPSQYILVGLIMATLFVLTVWGVVSLVMHLSGV